MKIEEEGLAEWPDMEIWVQLLVFIMKGLCGVITAAPVRTSNAVAPLKSRPMHELQPGCRMQSMAFCQ